MAIKRTPCTSSFRPSAYATSASSFPIRTPFRAEVGILGKYLTRFVHSSTAALLAGKTITQRQSIATSVFFLCMKNMRKVESGLGTWAESMVTSGDWMEAGAVCKLRRRFARQKALRACTNCKKRKAKCEDSRPCRNCIARGKESTCIDETSAEHDGPEVEAVLPMSEADASTPPYLPGETELDRSSNAEEWMPVVTASATDFVSSDKLRTGSSSSMQSSPRFGSGVGMAVVPWNNWPGEVNGNPFDSCHVYSERCLSPEQPVPFPHEFLWNPNYDGKDQEWVPRLTTFLWVNAMSSRDARLAFFKDR